MSEVSATGDNETPAAFSSSESAPEHLPPAGDPASGADQWVLQAEAAEVVGCSISAIRKWRREGTVSSRRTETSGGMERVEVRLADVQARAGQRVRPHPPPLGGSGAAVVPPGMVMVPMLDLGHLYRQVSEADRRTSDAEGNLIDAEGRLNEAEGRLSEAEGRLIDAESRLIDAEGKLIEAERRLNESMSENRLLRDELAQTRARPAQPRSDVHEPHRSHPPRADRGPSPVTTTAGRQPPSAAPALPRPDRAASPDRPGVPVPDPGRARPAPRQEAPNRVGTTDQGRRGTEVAPQQRGPAVPGDRSLATLASELRRLYRSLQAHQRADSVDPKEHRRWTVELAAYDRALLVACRAFGVRVPPGSGQRLQPAERVELTRGLAAAGLDVRSSGP